ncbi:hypothetical protein [Azospirillum sp. sgz302134]
MQGHLVPQRCILSRSDLAALLDRAKALATEQPSGWVTGMWEIRDQLCDALPGSNVPGRDDDDVAERLGDIDRLFVGTSEGNPASLPSIVDELYALLTRPITSPVGEDQ